MHNFLLPEYRIPVYTLILSGILWLTSLYQLEILMIWISQGKYTFEFPFYIYTCSVWMARDIFYGVNATAYALLAWGMARLSGEHMKLKMSKT